MHSCVWENVHFNGGVLLIVAACCSSSILFFYSVCFFPLKFLIELSSLIFLRSSFYLALLLTRSFDHLLITRT